MTKIDVLRTLLRKILLRPVVWAAQKFSSKPQRKRIFKALDELYKSIRESPGDRGLIIPFRLEGGRCIILSDQHKGGKDGADDFQQCEPNYLGALDYYYRNDFLYVNLGDSEELWENSLSKVKKANQPSFDEENKFLRLDRLVKIFGNHDLYWDNDPLASWQLKEIYNDKLKVYEGVVLAIDIGGVVFNIFCTHGHQGDAQSDGNWFSKFFVARIWAPLQAYLRINPNTPAYDGEKKTLHNEIMYEWSAQQQNTILITGHTHQPVFRSLTLLERLYRNFQDAQQRNDEPTLKDLQAEIRKREREFSAVAVDYMSMRPFYFNSGCCCFSDGDITGIEIADGCIRLVKWTLQDESPTRIQLEEAKLAEFAL